MLSSVQKRRNSNVVRLVLGIVACLILMDHSFADTATSTSTDSTTAIAVSNEESKEQVLKFLLLGDWGKGGNSGYSTTRIPDMPEVTNDDESPIVFPKTYNTMESAFDNRLTDVHVMGNRSRGLQDATYQAAVAAGMASYSKNFEPSFVVALGDNFYVNGVSSSTDVYWDYLWTNVYLDNYPQLRIPWYPVFGNHDYGYGSTGVQAQLDRTLIDDYWSMKSTNYSKSFSISDDGEVIIVFVDTTTLAPSVNKCCNENGGISTAVQASRIQNQLKNLDSILSTANKTNPTWLLVAGHYPIYSKGQHGDTSELKSYLLPLLLKYKVHAYLCGHDHLSEHLSKDGIHYFVNGGGCMTDSVGGDSDAEMHWAGEGYSAFASATASTEQLTINFVDADANTKYTYTLTNPRSGIPYVEPEEEISLAAAAYKTMLLPVACAGLALVLISAGFFFDARGRKKKRKAEKAVKSLLASTIPPSASIFKTGKQMSKVRSFLRASSLQPKSMKIIDSKNTSLSVETSNLMTSSNSVPTSLQQMTADGTVEAWTSSSDNNEEPFHSTAKATRSAVAVVHRSKNGQLFAAVPMGRNEHHKRARTSIF